MGQGTVSGQSDPQKAIDDGRDVEPVLDAPTLEGIIEGQQQQERPDPTTIAEAPDEDPQPFQTASANNFDTATVENGYRDIKDQLVEETLEAYEEEQTAIEELEAGEALTVGAGEGGFIESTDPGTDVETGTDPEFASNARRLQLQDDQQLGTPETQSYNNLEAAPDSAGAADEGWAQTGSGQSTARIEYDEEAIDEILNSPTNPYTTNKKDIIAGLEAADNGLTSNEEIERVARQKLAAFEVEVGEDNAYARPEGTPVESFYHEIAEAEDDLEIEVTSWGTVDHDGLVSPDEERLANQRVTETADVQYPSSDFKHADPDSEDGPIAPDTPESNDPAAGFGGVLPGMSEQEATETLTNEFSAPSRALGTVTDEYDVDRTTAKKAVAFAVTQHEDIEKRKATAQAVAATEKAGFDERVFTHSEVRTAAGGDHRDDPELTDPKNPGRSLPNDDYWRDGTTRGNIAGTIDFVGDAKGDADTYAYVSPPGSSGDFGEQIKVTFYDQASAVRDATQGDLLAVEDAKIEWRYTNTDTGDNGYEPVATVKTDTKDVAAFASGNDGFSETPVSRTSHSNNSGQSLTYTQQNIASGDTPHADDETESNNTPQPTRHDGTESATMGAEGQDQLIDDVRREQARKGGHSLWIDSTGEIRSRK